MCTLLAASIEKLPSSLSHSSNSVLLKTRRGAAGDNVDQTTKTVELATAWARSRDAVQVLYAFDDEQIIQGMIAFWKGIADIIMGNWTPCSEDDPVIMAQHVTVFDHQHTQVHEYVCWLYTTGPALILIIIQQMFEFFSLTGIRHLSTTCNVSMLKTLLVFLQISAAGDPSAITPR